MNTATYIIKYSQAVFRKTQKHYLSLSSMRCPNDINISHIKILTEKHVHLIKCYSKFFDVTEYIVSKVLENSFI